jgi:hypothetical protein
MRALLQHYLSPLHLYCRLCPAIGARRTRLVAAWLETILRPVLYGR